MAKIAPSTFTRFELTYAEKLAGQILTYDQKCVIQTERADIADQLINLDFDPEHTLLYTQQEAFLRGQLSVYTVMLEQSARAEAELNNPDFNPEE